MGNCCSKKKALKKSPTSPGKTSVLEAEKFAADELHNRAPSLEEETVKEVLAETAKPVKEVVSRTLKPSTPKIEEEKAKKIAPVIEKIAPVPSCDEISEVSEVCNWSGSFSTTTLAEKKADDDGEVEMRPKDNISAAKFQRERPVAGDFHGRRERGGRSPARRSDRSPAKRMPALEVSPRQRTPISRRDPAEESGRRSGSPAKRMNRKMLPPKDDLGRCPSARRTGRSPGRVPSGLPPEEVGQISEEAKVEVQPGKESLEDPLVSLECFIFL